jgi:hypothetical protein
MTSEGAAACRPFVALLFTSFFITHLQITVKLLQPHTQSRLERGAEEQNKDQRKRGQYLNCQRLADRFNALTAHFL